MTIHMFGAFFGLAASYFFHNKTAKGHTQNSSNYSILTASFSSRLYFGKLDVFVVLNATLSGGVVNKLKKRLWEPLVP